MTFLDKLKQDNPNMTEEELTETMLASCPDTHRYDGDKKCINTVGTRDECRACWNREMPKTEVKDEPSCDDVKAAYEQGLNDAWELAKMVVRSPKLVENAQIFLSRNIVGIERESLLIQFFELTPQEALAKLKAYEEANSFRLGEIVIVNIPDEKGIVIVKCEDGEYKVLMEDFDIVKLPASKLIKTGRFVALDNILEQIGDE